MPRTKGAERGKRVRKISSETWACRTGSRVSTERKEHLVLPTKDVPFVLIESEKEDWTPAHALAPSLMRAKPLF